MTSKGSTNNLDEENPSGWGLNGLFGTARQWLWGAPSPQVPDPASILQYEKFSETAKTDVDQGDDIWFKWSEDSLTSEEKRNLDASLSDSSSLGKHAFRKKALLAWKPL